MHSSVFLCLFILRRFRSVSRVTLVLHIGVLPRRTDCPCQYVVCALSRRHLGLPVSHPLLSVHVDLKQRLAVCIQSNIHQLTQHLYLYSSGFSSGLSHTTQYKRPSLEESFIMHSRVGLAYCLVPSHSLCELPPLKPPLIVLGTVVQVFSSSRGLCSMLPWHSMVATPCQVPLTSCSTSSDTVLVLCDACGDWTSGAGFCRRLVDS